MNRDDSRTASTSSLTTNRTPPPVPPRHLKPVIADLQYNRFDGGVGTVVESSEAKHPEHNLRPDANDGGSASRQTSSAAMATAGTALNAARHISSSPSSSAALFPGDIEGESVAHVPVPAPVPVPVPDTIIGADAVIQGSISCNKVLRLNGRLEGKLVSTGSLIVGPRGVLVGEVAAGCQHVQVEGGGKVVGNVTADKVVLLGTALVQGDIVCKSMQMGAEAVVVGQVNVHPLVPAALVVEWESGSAGSSGGDAAERSVEVSTLPVAGTESHHEDGHVDSSSASSSGSVSIGGGVSRSGGDNGGNYESNGSSSVPPAGAGGRHTERESSLSVESDA